MALKKNVEKEPEVKEEVKTDDRVVLELSLYTNYTMGGKSYLKGVPYKFQRDVAFRLLEERDSDRPVWKVYRPEKPKVEKKPTIVEAEDVTIEEVEIAETAPANKKTRLDVGDDSEIADILNREDDTVEI